MSKISSIYDRLHTVMASSLSAYARLPDNYDIEGNPHLLIDKGYAIRPDAAENTNRSMGTKRSISRQFVVTFVQDITNAAHDAEKRSEIDKGLLEDQKTLLDALIDDPTLNGNASKAQFIGDSGLLVITGPSSNQYMALDTLLQIDYFETFGS